VEIWFRIKPNKNKDVTKEIWSKTKDNLNIKNFKLPITKWVDIKEIDKPTTTQTQLGGYLKNQ
jgi:hypothetical protein